MLIPILDIAVDCDINLVLVVMQYEFNHQAEAAHLQAKNINIPKSKQIDKNWAQASIKINRVTHCSERTHHGKHTH